MVEDLEPAPYNDKNSWIKESEEMAEEQERPKCDIDDILCQLKILDSLRVIKDATNEERFQKRFPELIDLGNTLASKISDQELILRSAFEQCGLLDPRIAEIEKGEKE